MYVHIRYESILVLGIILIGLWIFKYLKWSHVKDQAMVFSLTPLLFLPVFWQRILTQGHYENPPGVPLFSLERFGTHFVEMLSSLGLFNFKIPYANGVIWLGLLCLIKLTLGHFQAPRESPSTPNKWKRDFGIIFGVCFVALNGLFLSHHFGVFSHPTQARFFMTFSLTLASLPIFASYLNPKFLSSKVLLAIALVSFAIYHPFATENRYINSLILDRETDFSYQFLNRVGRQEILIINDRPGQYTAINFGAVDFGYANNNRNELISDLGRHLFQDIYVFQHINYTSQLAVENQKLSDAYKLKTLEEIQISAEEFLRISRVSLD